MNQDEKKELNDGYIGVIKAHINHLDQNDITMEKWKFYMDYVKGLMMNGIFKDDDYLEKNFIALFNIAYLPRILEKQVPTKTASERKDSSNAEILQQQIEAMKPYELRRVPPRFIFSGKQNLQ